MAKSKGPRLPDWETIQAMFPGLDPNNLAPMKNYMKQVLRINDQQIAVNKYKWFNLPPEIDPLLLERILYYRGKGMLFFIPELQKFYFLPYALCGEIDMYGRYTRVKPLPFMGKDETSDNVNEEKKSPMSVLISAQERIPVYDTSEIITPNDFLETRCILLTDYCKQISQTVLPRQTLSEGLIDIESNIIPYMMTLLSNSTGIMGVRVNGDDEASQIQQASDTANLAALNQKKYLAINSVMELQDLTSGGMGRAEDMLLSMQSLDNIRLGTHGVDNGGIFEKKAHMLNAEAAMNTGTSSLIMEDGLVQRQQLCDIFNHYLYIPLGYDMELMMDCQISEVAAGNDNNFDGIIGGGNNQMPAQGVAEGAAGGETDGE